MHDPEAFYNAVELLETNSIPIDSFIRRLFAEPRVSSRPIVFNFIQEIPRLLDLLQLNDRTHDIVDKWMKNAFTRKLERQIRDVSHPAAGFHFVAKSATADRLKEVTISKLTDGLKSRAPDVWDLVGRLLRSDPEVIRRREKARQDRETARREGGGTRKRKQRNQVADDEDEVRIFDLIEDDEDEPEDIEEQLEQQWKSLATIKQIVCISIMMHASNQRCNAFQTLVGVFLQACVVPDSARRLLAHLGVSVAVSTIETTLKSLSKEAFSEMQRLGATFTTAYAYDNLDIDLKPLTPTYEQTAQETLVHLTTAAMFPLNHGIRVEDLEYSDFMWKLMKNPPLFATTAELFKAVPSQPPDSKGLRARDRFNAWKFRYDLIHYGPAYFTKFKRELGDAEIIEGIPVTKTKQVPMRASKTGPSTPAKNAVVLEEMFKQSAIGELTESPTSSPSTQSIAHLENRVTLVFGDLLTVQHMRSLQLSRLNDVSPFRRFQFVVVGHGWFHVRMACAQTIWRRHINASGAKTEANSLISYVAQIRPQERPKIESDPTFRQMHEVITHVGITLRHDAWREQVHHQDPLISSLEEWALTEPTWDNILDISEEMAKKFLAPVDLRTIQNKPSEDRDKQFEVILMLHRDFLLYEETNYAMNFGDIGRLDQCMLVWMHLFMGCGKAKYGMEMRHYLENMYIQYPKPLANAIRMNSLSNPTGRKGHFRGIDWEIELLNMYIKRYHGGRDSNHTVNRMVEESPLIEVYKDTRVQFEQMFCLEHKTTRHSPAKMKLTFEKASRFMEKHRANQFIPGRDSEYEITDLALLGMTKLIGAIDKARSKQKKEANHFEGLEKTTDEQANQELRSFDEETHDDDVDFAIGDDGSLFC